MPFDLHGNPTGKKGQKETIQQVGGLDQDHTAMEVGVSPDFQVLYSVEYSALLEVNVPKMHQVFQKFPPNSPRLAHS